MDLSALMKKYAEQIGGQYTEYDSLQSIIIVPVSGGRFQTVVGNIVKNDLYNRQLISLRSKVCPAKKEMDYKMLLEQTVFFNYCRFIIKDNYIQIEAVAPLSSISEETVKEMLQEVANLADQFELKLTGADIY
ncbi:MAG: helix-turn-helix domain-containing protein [Bacteroidetes bacterium]|nr:helix-turn-helix domain-containing protein [Bacteroidota bacterium]MBS1539282.1 helix-turn-helix domain-containing protein [Bacteroidota bacterium]